MRAKWKKWLPACIAVLAGLYLLLWQLVLPKGLNQAIPLVEQTAAEYINGTLDIAGVKVGSGLTFTLTDVRVNDLKGREFAHIPALSLHLNPLKAITGGALGTVTRITLQNPAVNLIMDEQDQWNVAGLLKESESSNTDFKGKIAINNGTLSVATPYGSWQLGMDGDIDPSQNPIYGINLTLMKGSEALDVSGHINTDKQGTLTVKTDQLGLGDFAGLAAHFLPMEGLKGTVRQTAVTWTQNDSGSQLSGNIRLDKVGAVYTYDGHPLAIAADGKLTFSDMRFRAQELVVTVNGQKAGIQGLLDLTDTSQPRAEKLKVSLAGVDLDELGLDLPAQAVVDGTVTLSGGLDDLQGEGIMTTPSLEVMGYTLTDVKLPVSVHGTRAEVTGAAAGLEGGWLEVTASYDWQEKQGVASLDVTDLDAGLFYPRIGSLVLNGGLVLQGSYDDDGLQVETETSDLALTWGDITLQDISLNAVLKGSDVAVNRISAYTAEGGALAGTGSLIDGQLAGDLYATDISITPFLGLAGQEGSGLLSLHVKVSGPRDNPKAFGALSLKEGEILKEKITEAHGVITWEDSTLGLHRVEISPEKGRHNLDGTIYLGGNDPVLHLTLDTTAVRLEPLSDLGISPLPVTGNLTNTIKVDGPLSNPSFTGHIHAFDGSLNKFLFDELDGDYTYDGKVLTLRKFRFMALGCRADFAGTVTREGFLNLGVDAKNINLLRLPWLKDDVDLAGHVNFSGSITGHYSRPSFQGVMTSNSVLINGVEFTGLALSFQSQGGHVNSFEGTFQQKTGGDYSLKAYFDFDKKLFSWTADVDRGNVRSLLKMGGMDLDIDGYLSGRIQLNPHGRGSGMTIVGKVEDCKVGGVPFNSADFDIFTHRGNWQIRKLQAQEKGGGLLAAQGSFDLFKRNIDLEVAANGINAKLLNVAMAEPMDLQGSMNIAAQFKGNLDMPDGNMSLELNNGAVSGVSFDNVYGMVTLRKDMFTLDQFLIQKDVYKVSAYGTFPMDLFRAKAKRKDPDAHMNLEFRLDNGNLAILPSITKYVQWADGATKGNVTVSGTLEDYRLDGSLDLEEGTIKTRLFDDTFDHIKLHTIFNGKTITLQELSTTTGKNGTITASGSYQLNDTSGKPYELLCAIRNVELQSSNLKGKVNGDITVNRQNDMPFVTANIDLDKVYIGLNSIPEFGEGGADIGLDVNLDLGDNLRLYNASLMDLRAKGKLHITGTTGNPSIAGSIRTNRGSILKYLGTPFRIGYGELYWPMPGTFIPMVNMRAFTRLGQYNIIAKVNSPLSLDELQIHFSSDPPQNEDTLKRFLTLKTDDTNLEGDAWQGLADAGLQLSYLANVEDAIKDALGLDDLRIYSGNIQNGLGFSADSRKANTAIGQDRRQYNVLLSRYFGHKLMLGYTTSFDGERSSAFAQYYITRHLNLGFSVNQDQEHWYGVQYRTRF